MSCSRPARAGPDELEDFADDFAARLDELDELVEHVDYRFELDREFLELFYKNAVRSCPRRLPELEARLTDEAISSVWRRSSSTWPRHGPFTQEFLVNDPLHLMPLFLNRLEGNRGVLQIDLSDATTCRATRAR